MYSEQILNEFYNPEHYGVIRGANGVGKVVCDIGNEIIKIFISVENNRIVDAEFQTFGGVVAIALTSFATNLIYQRTLDDAMKLDANAILAMAVEVPESKSYLVHAVVNCVHLAVESYYRKDVKSVD